jgi:hypothetical protein
MNWIAVGDFFSRTWYVWLIIAGLIGFWLYSTKLDSYSKYKLSKTFTKTRVIFILMIVGWFLWNKFGNMNEVSDANRWMPVILLLYLSAVNYVGKLRYDTQQFVSPNFHGSYAKNPYYVNGFYIFAIGSFNAGGIAWDYANKIAIVREETVELFLQGGLSISELAPVSKYELDDDVRKFIEKHPHLKGATEQIFYGWFDSIEKVDYDFQQLQKLQKDNDEKNDNIYNLLKKELGVKNPKIETLYWMYKNQCKATGKQTEVLDGTVEAVEKGVEHHKRVKDAYVDKRDQQPKYEGGEESY